MREAIVLGCLYKQKHAGQAACNWKWHPCSLRDMHAMLLAPPDMVICYSTLTCTIKQQSSRKCRTCCEATGAAAAAAASAAFSALSRCRRDSAP